MWGEAGPRRTRPADEGAAGHGDARFRLAFDRAPVAMALEGPDGRFLRVNDAFCRLTGYTESELLARTAEDICHPDDRAALRAQRDDLAAGRMASRHHDLRLVGPDGRALRALVSRSALRAGDGPTEFVTHMVDVSEERARLGPVPEEAAGNSAELAAFASLAAHELRSPLQAVSGFASLLARLYSPALDERGKEFVAWIEDGAVRLQALIADLSTFARAGTDEAATASVRLEDVARDVLRSLEAHRAATGAQVTSGPLPTVAGDPAQLGQVLHHLIANACTFVGEAVVPRVHLSADRTADGWVVTVADNGVGVDPARREDVFRMFTRLHQRERGDGTGVGLAITRRIVEARGGAIWVEDNPGGGSRFRFTVPDRDPRVTARSGSPRSIP